ncbi:MAG TPA: CoA pyrophosphatase [Dehalococcoidia bacterium]|nr:CoA pyrophosphatase [Dehalococcoidia bacterium]
MTGEDLIQRALRALAAYKPQRLDGTMAAPAAVLLPLYRKEDEPNILLTLRTDHVEHHKGQISFPGGASDADDPDLLTTALRETFEEVGIRPEHVEIIGTLDDLITISDFRVTPYVGLVRGPCPYPFAPHQREVAALIEVPLRHLLSPYSMELELRELRGEPVLVPAYTYGPHRIWGATARILKGFLDLLS